jgi:hypothetical protein
VTVGRNGNLIESQAESLNADIDAAFSLIYTGATRGWKFTPYSGLQGVTGATGATGPAGIEMVSVGWNPASDSNLGQDTDVYAPYNGTLYNTDSSTFELVNSNSSSPMARVHIKTGGYYRFDLQLHAYDLKNNNDIRFVIFTSSASNGAFSQVRYVSVKRSGSDNDTGLTTEEVSVLLKIDNAGYYTWAFNSDDTNPFALAAPENGLYAMRMDITKMRGL